MDCREFENVAGVLLEGESHPEAYTHLASCPRCRLRVDELMALERAARTLPTHEPSGRLWERLEAAATQEGLWGRSAGWQWFGPAWNLFPARAAFAGVLGVLLLLGVGLVGYPALESPMAETAAPTAFEVAQGELVQDVGYTARYEIHLNHVEDRVLAAAVPVDAALRELVAGPLNAVDHAIEQTQSRLTSYPDDYLAREELHRLYRQKVTVLQAALDPAWQEVAR